MCSHKFYGIIYTSFKAVEYKITTNSYCTMYILDFAAWVNTEAGTGAAAAAAARVKKRTVQGGGGTGARTEGGNDGAYGSEKGGSNGSKRGD